MLFVGLIKINLTKWVGISTFASNREKENKVVEKLYFLFDLYLDRIAWIWIEITDLHFNNGARKS